LRPWETKLCRSFWFRASLSANSGGRQPLNDPVDTSANAYGDEDRYREQVC
jgi:hypothetical protein